jgi:NADP-dependent aldehyde dehydrogenase
MAGRLASGRLGEHFVAGVATPGSGAAFTAIDPTTGAAVGPTYHEATAVEVERAAQAAGAVAWAFAAAGGPTRAGLLRGIAGRIEALGDELLACYGQETALPRARAEAELARTLGQLRRFADLAAEGSWVDARIDRALPQRQPVPRPDLRRMLVGIGPVVVFGASNFPLAYSVAGGDTASALAAGCPVLVKGHPAHPGTSELVGRAIAAAVHDAGLPGGVFSLLHGASHELGAALVRHPAVAAVGFTGSHRGGRALMDLAAARPEPIPVFAEMGSMNPVVVLPEALANRGAAIGKQVAASALLASGQFCTSPGLILWIDGPGATELREALRDHLGAAVGAPTVHPSIRDGYVAALGEVLRLPVQVESRGQTAPAATAVCPTLLTAAPAALLGNPRLRSEIYGPAVLAVACADAAELRDVLQSLHGHLTGTVHGEGRDFASHGEALAVLRRKVGRLLANGVPTGVEVCGAMVHGGPYPAAADVRFSAVGPTSILRWARPMCWQDWPAELLPPELRDDNPLGIRRTVDDVVV